MVKLEELRRGIQRSLQAVHPDDFDLKRQEASIAQPTFIEPSLYLFNRIVFQFEDVPRFGLELSATNGNAAAAKQTPYEVSSSLLSFHVLL